jgi:hypothetical protein
MTYKEYIQANGITSPAARKRAQKFHETNGTVFSFGLQQTVPDGFVSFFETGKKVLVSKPKSVTIPVSKPKQETEQETQNEKPRPVLQPPTPQNETKPQTASKPWIDRSALLLGINVLETVVSIRGGYVSYGWMGIVVVFSALFYYWFVILDSKDPNSTTDRDLCLFVCFILSCLFGWFHFQAFQNYNQSVFVQNCCFAGIVSGLGFVAVLQTVPKK